MGLALAHRVADLRETVAGWRREGLRVALVPTMGALHEGHLSLLQAARDAADRVVVSIFVNPTQFGPNEDFGRYPRTLDEDCRRIDGVADLAYAPAVDEMYRPGAATAVMVEGPAVVGLEDRIRPGHFAGVATVCTKLFTQALPDVAVFGEKDFQQLKVVTRLVTDLDLPLAILPGPTLRESDGLALSSRNRYLSPEDRAKAPRLHESLQACAARIRAGEAPAAATARAVSELTLAGFMPDYVEARDAETLLPPGPESGLRLLCAARLGQTRLIDNIPV